MTLPQVFHLGPLTVHYYGVILAVAVLSAYWLGRRRAAAYGLSRAQIDSLVVWAVVAGFIGARLYHVITEFGFYAQHPAQIFAVWQGGLSIFGALLGGLIGLWLGWRKQGRPAKFLSLLDWLAPSILLGQIVGRFGNLFNYEIFGKATELPWKMFVPLEFRPTLWRDFSYFHPLFLYEVVLNSLILIILLAGIKNRFRAGSLFFSYLFLYNAVRFFLEWYRLDNVYIGRVPLNAITAAVLVFASLLILVWLHHERFLSPHNQRRT